VEDTVIIFLTRKVRISSSFSIVLNTQEMRKQITFAEKQQMKINNSKTLIYNSYLIRQSFLVHRCISGINILNLRMQFLKLVNIIILSGSCGWCTWIPTKPVNIIILSGSCGWCTWIPTKPVNIIILSGSCGWCTWIPTKPVGEGCIRQC